MARNVPTPGGAEIIDVMLLRKAIGVLGVALPFLLWFGGLAARVALQPSISRYYHTQMHDTFVGVLCAIGLGLKHTCDRKTESEPSRRSSSIGGRAIRRHSGGKPAIRTEGGGPQKPQPR